MPQQRMVDAPTLRRMFNEGRYWEQLQAGQLVSFAASSRHPAPPPTEPFCTMSQVLHYYTPALEKVAIVHQYLRPDGTLGASGRPDPKAVIVGGIRYILDPGQH